MASLADMTRYRGPYEQSGIAISDSYEITFSKISPRYARDSIIRLMLALGSKEPANFDQSYIIRYIEDPGSGTRKLDELISSRLR